MIGRRTRRDGDRTQLRLGVFVLPDWALFLAVCLIPVGFMVTRSFGRLDPITLDVELSGTVDAYRVLFSPTYRPVLVRSLALASFTVMMCLALGTPAALALSRLSPRVRVVCLVAVMLPSFVSFTVRIFALQGVLAVGGPVQRLTGAQFLFSPPAVLLGMMTAYLPLFILPAYVALVRVPRSMIEAAADLGARHWRQLFSVTLPLALPGIVTGAALVGVLAVGEFIIPAVLGGGKVLLLGTILAERGAGRDQPLGGAITVFMLGVFAVVGLVVALVRRRSALRA